MIIERMRFVKLFTKLLGFLGSITVNGQRNSALRSFRAGQCGTDRSSTTMVYEGYARVETYSWLGVLYYTTRDKQFSTSVVLVTKQIVIGSAMDIEKLPKMDFRSHSRVVLGRNCSNPGVQVRDYSYHPDFNRATYSALALIQLEIGLNSYWIKDLNPICPPPAPDHYTTPRFYAVAHSDDCKSSIVTLHKMAYVDSQECEIYYRKSELNVEKMWPAYTICAKALTGTECVWTSGSVLAMRQNNIWHLIGFGIYGPGCSAPSRYLDYARYRPWVRSSVSRIGRPTVTRIAPNHIVLRRSLSNIQRYGPCDPEEIRAELFTDRTTIARGPTYKRQRVSYNVCAQIYQLSLEFTIFANLEYSCVVFQSFVPKRPKWIKDIPYIRLKRWCLSPKPICYSLQFLQIDFAIEIYFKETITYQVLAYGKEVKVIDMKKLMSHVNSKKPYVEVY